MDHSISFGKYLLLDRVNVGGMAEVFIAKAFGIEGFERILAIKRILPNMAEDDEFIKMFVDEARIAVQLSHSNVVQVYELGKFHEQYYIAMEYCSGKDLRQILDVLRRRKEIMAVPMAAFIASKICDGLDYAHRKTDHTGRPLNVIHRDVSPQNILIGYEGEVKITDFGIAKAEDRASKTQAGVLKGKFGYMSPEQVRGMTIDHRSDIFAVGILLYEMMTNARLFVGESDFSTLEKVRSAKVGQPRDLNPDIPPAFEEIMLKALARDRDERYAWASELHDDLQQFLIEENTIYSSKRLAGVLAELYPEAIEAERCRLEEAMRAHPPNVEEARAGIVEMRDAAVRRNTEEDCDSQTSIFESGFGDSFATAPTAIGDGSEGTGPGEVLTAETVQADGDAAASQPAATGSVGRRSTRRKNRKGRTSDISLTALRRRRQLSALLIASLAFMTLLSLLLYLLLVPSDRGVGTIIVTTSPANLTTVEIVLDGKLLTKRTPVVRSDIPLGNHLLEAKAKGYPQKTYSFTLVAGSPATIDVNFGPATGPQILDGSPTRAGVVEIVSDPPGATVVIDGASRGATPLTLTGIDRSHTTVIVISKAGYRSASEEVVFGPDESIKRLRVALSVLSRSHGELVVTSRPAAAVVYLNGKRKGVTPVTIDGLDRHTKYELELTKSGYRRFRDIVRLDGQPVRRVVVELAAAKKDGGDLRRPRSGSRNSCGGSGAKLSVQTGEADCRVSVGKSKVGVPPFFKHDVPVGRCTIQIVCPSGKGTKVTRTLNKGEHEVIKPSDLR